MKSTKIVCTIGPSASDLTTIKKMLIEGMNVARFNMSHGTHESHAQLIKLCKQASAESNLPLAIMVDTKGPEIRVGHFDGGSATIEKGRQFVLTTRAVVGSSQGCSISYQYLPQQAAKGMQILIDDGNIELKVERVEKTEIITKVVVGGKISDRKSVNIPNLRLEMPYVSEADKKDIMFACEQDADYLAISFVSQKEDVLSVKKLLAKLGKPNMKIISKIENQMGVDNAHEILEVSDGIMVARGDLGVEVDYAQIPFIQKYLINECKEHGKISITATQMLESMSQSNRPTRAEIADVANAICDGTSAIMLSAETSAGKHPALCVKTMAKIADEMDNNLYGDDFTRLQPENMSKEGNIGYGACALEYAFGDSLIACIENPILAKSISNFRPNTKILLFTGQQKVYQEAALWFAVVPVLINKTTTYADCVGYAAKFFKKKGYIIMAVNDTLKVEKV